MSPRAREGAEARATDWAEQARAASERHDEPRASAKKRR
jgi:hypothetical protein